MKTYCYSFITFALSLSLSVFSVAAEDNLYHKPWKMREVRTDYLIANSLNEADVNGDGLPDYAVIDEWLGLQTILFHPGLDKVKSEEPWPRLVLGKTGNPEYSSLGDLDGDGHPDLVVVEGDDLARGFKTGVRFYFNPGKEKVMDPAAWIQTEHIPGNSGEQYLYSESHDINGDGAIDVVIGGRRHVTTKKYAGLRWLEAPADPKQRRDVNQWKTHFIDPNALSGHAFVFVDIDGDGDLDIVDGNADWDTPEFDEDIAWYENPGKDSPDLRSPWKRHLVWKGTDCYAKPQIAVGDVDQDGKMDLATQTQNSILLFLQREKGGQIAWEKIEIPKPDNAQWIGRPIKFADLDGDGKLDIFGALIHNDGNLPKDKLSVFWMKHRDGADWKTWDLFPIKQSDGYNSRIQWAGEKWDHTLPVDLDGDGDLDIIGNVEEHYHYPHGRKDAEGKNLKPVSFWSVVWFENPLK